MALKTTPFDAAEYLDNEEASYPVEGPSGHENMTRCP
jgi:hypothetical protein